MAMELAERNGTGEYERDGSALSTISSTAVESMSRAEIDVQISTAKRYPRSLAKVKDEATTLACMDVPTAFSCWYTVPRGGKNIEGPSVRLAEIMASAWGNLRYGARVIDEDQHFITVQGFAHDLEKNQAVTFEIRRRITYKDGRKFNDDMIAVTANAASAIALRNCIFRVVPRSLVNLVLTNARRCAEGSIKNLEDSRMLIAKYFAEKKIEPKRMLAVVNRQSVDDITINDVLILRNIAESVKNGDITLDEAFPVARETLSSLGDQVKAALPVTSDIKPVAVEVVQTHPAKNETSEPPKQPETASPETTTTARSPRKGKAESPKPSTKEEMMDEAGPIPPLAGKKDALFDDGGVKDFDPTR